MSFPCPYCNHRIKLKGAKPGKYTPNCPKCAKAFQLTVPAEGDPIAAAIVQQRVLPSTVKLPPKPKPKAPPADA